jgi:hypothetical protein
LYPVSDYQRRREQSDVDELENRQQFGLGKEVEAMTSNISHDTPSTGLSAAAIAVAC